MHTEIGRALDRSEPTSFVYVHLTSKELDVFIGY